jgi:protein involved in polysaccharide export with SLBB domain
VLLAQPKRNFIEEMLMMKRIGACFALVMLACNVTLLDAQEGGGGGTGGSEGSGITQGTEVQGELLISNLSPSAQLALSSPDYMVTAGDIYTLTYFANTTPVEFTITVDSTYRIRVSNLGVIDGSGKTFNQLKSQVETIVLNNYPLGAAQLVLRQPAVFKIYIKGEVQTTREMQVWALSRLSSVLGGSLTSYSSTRNIQIRSSNGQVRTYDLFMANRAGDLSQNPFVRPDDTITINRIGRRVTINGAVERPGTYELLRGENLKQLVEVYGYGLTDFADTTRIDLVRYINSESGSGDRTLLSNRDLLNNYPLQNFDVITIRSVTAVRPVVTQERYERQITIEGAVRRPGTYQLRPDENLKDLVEVYGDGLTDFADTARIDLVRYTNSESGSGDRTLLSNEDFLRNYRLEHLDVITIRSIIAERPVVTQERYEREITIGGSVRRPGTYQLRPDENLKDLVEVYGDGLTLLADTTRIELTRYTNRVERTGDRISLDESDIVNDFHLEHLDSIMIPSITAFRPSFFVEGAVNVSDTALATSNHLTIDFVIGDTYGALLRRSESWFSAVSDTQNAYILRDGARIPLNINPLLYDANYQNDTEIRENDTLVVPFRQYFVSVAGAVYTPGRYPYIPDRDWDYYIGLAGGFTERNFASALTITDMDGKRMKKSDPITPETTITAQSNDFLYHFNRVAPVVTTTMSIISTFLTLMALGIFN